jgi:acylphosphatase
MAVPERIVRVMIKGRVQGVGFRAWTQGQAQARGIAGWVRNRSNGDVEAVFAGTAEAVEELCAACREGPPAARVSHVEELAADMRDLGTIEAKFLQLSTS